MDEIIKYGNLQRQNNTISRLLIYWIRIRELSSRPISVSKPLSEKLQDVSPRSRTMRLASCFQSVLAQYPDNVVIKDIDVMFNPAYQVDVLKLLTWVSLERAIGVEMDVFCQVEVVRLSMLLWPK